MSMDSLPLITIIIPTKNRYETLLPVVKSILNTIKSSDFEIVVQDNSDSNLPAIDYFETCKDNRLHYFYQSGSLSISENTTLAIEQIKGKYSIFIGDDDLVSPYICEIVKKLDNLNAVGLIYTPANYWWESVEFTSENYYYRKKALWIPKKISNRFVKKNSKSELDFMLGKGAVGYYQLPRFYHGIILTKALKDIKDNIGTYLSGSCPDIALSTSLAFVTDEYYFVHFPVSVFGACKNSGGGWTVNKTHFGRIEEQRFLQKGIVDRWDPNIPLIWSERTIYPQTVYETLKAFECSKKINYIAFYASMLANERFLFRYWYPAVKTYCRENRFNYLKIVLKYLKISTGIQLYKIKKMTRSFNYDVVHDQTIEQCMQTLLEMKFSDQE